MSLWQLRLNGVAAQLRSLASSLTCLEIHHFHFDMIWDWDWEESDWSRYWSDLAGIIEQARLLSNHAEKGGWPKGTTLERTFATPRDLTFNILGSRTGNAAKDLLQI